MTSSDAELANEGRRLARLDLDCFLIVITSLIGWVIYYLFVAGYTAGERETNANRSASCNGRELCKV